MINGFCLQRVLQTHPACFASKLLFIRVIRVIRGFNFGNRVNSGTSPYAFAAGLPMPRLSATLFLLISNEAIVDVWSSAFTRQISRFRLNRLKAELQTRTVSRCAPSSHGQSLAFDLGALFGMMSAIAGCH